MSRSRDRRRRQDRRDRNNPGTITIQPDFTAFNEAMERAAEQMRAYGQTWRDQPAAIRPISEWTELEVDQ